MKKAWITVAFVVLVITALTGLSLGQDKPRVFVQGKGSQNVTTSGSGGGGQHWGSWGARSSLDSHDEAMQVTRDLQKDCSGVIVTLNQSNADYTVMLNRESKHNRGLLRTNSQVQVANRLGDILGTSATRTVGNASKDACQLVLADWGRHRRTTVPDFAALAPAAASVVPATVPPPAEAAKPDTVIAAQSQPTAGSAAANAATSPSTKLQIESIPLGADIEVDGRFVGSTPSDAHVAAGEHTVVIRKSGFKTWKQKLKSTAGTSAYIIAELETNNP